MLLKLSDEFGQVFWHKRPMNRLDSVRPQFEHVTDWVFDLDNTLYPRECDLFAQIDIKISEYMVRVTGLPYAEARALQKVYYRDHGTSLHGLMLHHQVDPEHFLQTVHDIDYSGVPAHPGLAEALRALGVPTQLIVYPNQHHGLSLPSFNYDRLVRYVAWYDKYLKGATSQAGGVRPAR